MEVRLWNLISKHVVRYPKAWRKCFRSSSSLIKLFCVNWTKKSQARSWLITRLHIILLSLIHRLGIEMFHFSIRARIVHRLVTSLFAVNLRKASENEEERAVQPTTKSNFSSSCLLLWRCSCRGEGEKNQPKTIFPRGMNNLLIPLWEKAQLLPPSLR